MGAHGSGEQHGDTAAQGDPRGGRPVWLDVRKHAVGGQFQGLGALFGPQFGDDAHCRVCGGWVWWCWCA